MADDKGTIVLGGSGGLIGQRLIKRLQSKGYTTKRLVRPASKKRTPQDIPWDVEAGQLDPADLEGAAAVIHLGGENVAGGPWTKARKQRLCDSRIKSTSLLSDTIAKLESKPKAFLCASAVGYYGNQPDGAFDETKGPGAGFLADLCVDWEAACDSTRSVGVRTVNLRIGIVLSTKGGALSKMLLPFSLGLGGKVSKGGQVMSWIAFDDVVNAIVFCLEHDLSGPINLTSPNPATNQGFSATLAKILMRPSFLPLPGFAVKVMFGEMGESLLLGGVNAPPTRLLNAGFRFEQPDLEPAIRRVLKENV